MKIKRKMTESLQRMETNFRQKIVNRKATKKEKSMLKGKVRFKVTVRFQKVTELREAKEKWLDHDLR